MVRRSALAQDIDLGEKPEGELPTLDVAPVTSCCLSSDTLRGGLQVEPIRACYEDALERDVELAGKTSLRFTVAHLDGSVSDVELRPSLGDPEFDACVVAEVETWVFYDGEPVCSGEGFAIVGYPLLFGAE
ncbi:MAG: AgmX/PglI C-terminal domain-containing protein [Proteobacteria bacterium]|nr:AgmX/PglI C-terminal domain-containing protein [Pseudomonadota bacterium]MCP4918426.1 AgmX/PglI C-terminal domain-containing protein [Pseudomonadota bacterium]